MFDFSNTKRNKTVAKVVAGVLALAMILGMLVTSIF